MSACTCGQRRAPALCPRGPFGSGPGHRPYLPPEPNPDSLPPPLLVRGLLSPSPSPSPSTCPASRPGRRRGCAASRPARPRRPAQADSQGQPSPSPVLHPPPPRGRVSAARSASPAAAAVRRTGGRAVRGSGQCGACGDTALKAAWGAARAAEVEVSPGPLRRPLGNRVVFLPPHGNVRQSAVEPLSGSFPPSALELETPQGARRTLHLRPVLPPFPPPRLYLVSLPGARGPQRSGGCRVWKGPEARWRVIPEFWLLLTLFPWESRGYQLT